MPSIENKNAVVTQRMFRKDLYELSFTLCDLVGSERFSRWYEQQITRCRAQCGDGHGSEEVRSHAKKGTSDLPEGDATEYPASFGATDETEHRMQNSPDKSTQEDLTPEAEYIEFILLLDPRPTKPSKSLVDWEPFPEEWWTDSQREDAIDREAWIENVYRHRAG